MAWILLLYRVSTKHKLAKGGNQVARQAIQPHFGGNLTEYEMKRSTVIPAMLLLLAPAPGVSEENIAKGIWLLDHCSEKRETHQSMMNWTECVYYLNGLIDGYHLMRNMHTGDGIPIYDKNAGMCIRFPKRMTIGNMAGTVVRYLEKYPEQLDEPATMAAYNAFSDTFPCYE